MTNISHLSEHLLKGLQFKPNQDQHHALHKIAEFISPENNSDFFILTGPAGSGKTSLVKSITQYLANYEIDFYLAAPTGRSAQIISKKTSCFATTLHSLLYTPSFDEKSMQVVFTPKTNKQHTDVRYFIIDEASMISNSFSTNGMFIQHSSLLHQLIKYVKQGNSKNKMIIIGDKYQLPPITSSFSPALSSNFINANFNIEGEEFGLHIVERQVADSYVLREANHILNSINNNQNCDLKHFNKVSSFSSSIKHYLNNYSDNTADKSIMIAFANTQVNALNTWARNFRYNYKNRFEIMPDELLFCNHNIQVERESLNKGNHIHVRKCWKPEVFAGLNFINAEIEFVNIHNEKVHANSKILLESVKSVDGTIPFEAEKKLLHEAFRLNRKFRESRKPEHDTYVNAIRARYGYALTCHKAQGGEWEKVYIHPGYRKDNLRWLYTAVTRASEDLYSWIN